MFPRATTVFENENEIRLSPNANDSTTFGASGMTAACIIAPSGTTLEETVTRVRKRGHRPNSLPAVSEATGGGTTPTEGEALGNKTFALRGGAIPNTPETYALLFVDLNNSILGNSANGIVTVDYIDNTDTPRTEDWELQVDGKGPHYTAFPVKEVTSVVGSGFDVGGGGAPGASDTLIFGPACEDTVHGILNSSATTTGPPEFDPADVVSGDGDAQYIEASSVSDQRIYCSMPSISHLNPLSIASVTFQFYFKNIGATAVGVRGIMRTDPTNPDTAVTTAMTTTGSETGSYTSINSGALTQNPETTNNWTLAEIENLEVGVQFFGEAGPIAKRCSGIRVLIEYRAGFTHPSIDGSDLSNIDSAYLAVTKNNFTDPSSEDLQGVRAHSPTQSTDVIFNMEPLPSDAASVDQVETRARFTYRHVGDPNGAGVNDMPCGLGNGNRSNGFILHSFQGPREQTNLGGAFVRHNLPSAIIGERVAVGPGDPAGGCGVFGSFTGSDVGFGTYVEHVLNSVLNSAGNAISVSDVNGMSAGIRMADVNNPEYRLSRVYSYVVYRRNPVGESFFHLAVDDDPDSPSDAEYMASTHSEDKDFGVDFSGIPEVQQIFWVQVKVRGKTSASALRGWEIVWVFDGEEYVEPFEHMNTSFETKTYRHATSVFTGLDWRRDEVNGLQIYFRAKGETPYFEKDVSMISLSAEIEPIPEKVDTARRIASERLLLLGKPVPMFRAAVPLFFGDVRLLDDIAISHRALPRPSTALNLNEYERVPARVVEKVWDLENDRIEIGAFDLRDYLVTFLFTGESTSKGRSFDGTMIITNGVTVQFSRATNDYIEDPFAHLRNELYADEPPVESDGVLIQNGTTNLILNGGFALGATDVFTHWTKTTSGSGTIVEDAEDFGWDKNFPGAPQRSVLLTADAALAEISISQAVTLDTGDNLSPEGSNYCLSILHKDDDGYPLSVALTTVSGSTRFYRPADQTWNVAGALVWVTLPIRSERTVDRLFGTLDNLETFSAATQAVTVRLAARTFAGQRNHVYGVQLEGGTIELMEERGYPSSMILTNTGPVVRDISSLRVPSIDTHPTYYMVRGTFFCIVETEWDSDDLPQAGDARRYVYSFILDANNHDALYYDQLTQSWIFERKVATVVNQATFFYPTMIAGRPVRLATRWISPVAEFGETAHSIQIFVDDVRGTDASPGATPTHPASADFYIGSRSATQGTAFDGKIRRMRITQQVLPDSKIRKLR